MSDRVENEKNTRAGKNAGTRAKGSHEMGWSAGKKVGFALFLIVMLALVACVGVAAYGAFIYDKVYPGVSVGDIDLSGKTRAEALALIEPYLADISPGHSFQLTVGETVHTVEITRQDVGYDAKETAGKAYAYGRSGNIVGRVRDIFGARFHGAVISPECRVNETRVAEQAADIVIKTERDIIQAAYTFADYHLVVDRGQAGLSIDEAKLLTFLRDKLVSGDFSDASFELEKNEPDELDLLLIKSEIESEMQNPSLDLEADPEGNTIKPSSVGVHLDLQRAKDALKNTDNRYVDIPLDIEMPLYTDEQYKSLLFRDVLSEKTTDFNAGLVGRTKNVRLATEFVNGAIINPGEVFSYNDRVGKRTYERGFMDATIYVGAETEESVGGGVCQVSSTIYYCTLRADLEIVERKPHSRRVTYVPLGEDATVAWGFTDFKFKNNTDFPIKIESTHKKNTLTIKLIGTNMTPEKTVKMDTAELSYTPFEILYVLDPTLPYGTQKVDKAGYPGYRTETYRVVYINDVEVSRTFENKSAYTKYDKVILCNPLPADPNAPTTVPPATEPTQPTQPTGPVTEPTTLPPVPDPAGGEAPTEPTVADSE